MTTLKLEDFEPIYGTSRLGGKSYTASQMQQVIDQCNAKSSESIDILLRTDMRIYALENELAAAQAENEHLREAIDAHLNPCGCLNGCEFCKTKMTLEEALTTTSPSDYLQEHDAKLVERIAQVIQPEDSYQDEWFKAKADCYKRVMDIADKIKKGEFP
jgi:hypothetical protein